MPRTVVITGASGGIGEALAHRYAREAARLGLLGRNRVRLGEVAARCRRDATEVQTGSIDVRNRHELGEWLAAFDDVAPVDLLIANAGVMAGTAADGSIETSDDSRTVLETNVLGVVNAIHPLLPRMISRGRGQIGIVGSIAGFVPLPDSPSYCASKSAIMSYGLALRGLVRPRGIGVSVICAGYVTTSMSQQESGWKPFEMPAVRAAELIYRGLSRDQAVIAFPLLLAALARVGGALPDWARRWCLVPFRFTVTPRAGRNADSGGLPADPNPNQSG